MKGDCLQMQRHQNTVTENMKNHGNKTLLEEENRSPETNVKKLTSMNYLKRVENNNLKESQ
jgi:hypothetical protein